MHSEWNLVSFSFSPYYGSVILRDFFKHIVTEALNSLSYTMRRMFSLFHSIIPLFWHLRLAGIVEGSHNINKILYYVWGLDNRQNKYHNRRKYE
jgi:hypothetical protein